MVWIDLAEYTHTILFIWHRIMTSVSTEKFDFSKNWKRHKSTIKTQNITKKNILYEDSPGKKHPRRQNKSIKTWCLRSFVILWLVFGVLVLFFVFLFAIWFSSFLFFCLQWFCVFLDLTLFFCGSAAGFKAVFHYEEHQNKLLVLYNLGIKRETDPKCMKGRGDRAHPSLEYTSGFDMIRL